MPRPPEDDGYILEIHTIGHYMKVSAIDPASGLEVSVMGPASALSIEPLKRQAVAKLVKALKRNDSQGGMK